MLIVLVLILNKKNLINKGLALCLGKVSGIAIIFSMFITYLLPYTSKEYWFLNNLLSNRLQLQYKLFTNYSSHLFVHIYFNKAWEDK